MVTPFRGLRTDLAALRGRFPTSLNGIGMRDRVAQRLKLHPGVVTDPDPGGITPSKTKAILHWGLNHFFVLRRATASCKCYEIVKEAGDGAMSTAFV